jgi:ketosteroid isomerase-like protein
VEFGKREFLDGSGQSAGKMKISVQADVKELPVAGDLGYCWLKFAVAVTPPDGAAPMQRSGHTIGIYRREGDPWVLARLPQLGRTSALPS